MTKRNAKKPRMQRSTPVQPGKPQCTPVQALADLENGGDPLDIAARFARGQGHPDVADAFDNCAVIDEPAPAEDA